MNGDDGVYLFFTQGTHEVIGTLLHLGVGPLYGIQLNAATVAAGIHARDRASAESDAVVVAADHHNLISLLGCALQAVALGAVAHTSGKHDDLVVAVLFAVLFVFEGEDRTSDKWLTELVAEVAGTI